jgi:hypothetical protein
MVPAEEQPPAAIVQRGCTLLDSHWFQALKP